MNTSMEQSGAVVQRLLITTAHLRRILLPVYDRNIRMFQDSAGKAARVCPTGRRPILEQELTGEVIHPPQEGADLEGRGREFRHFNKTN